MNEKVNKISFDDVIGYEKEKDELKEIKNYIVNIKKYEEIGARVPKGILLVGESGNGKTLMAKALATEINIPFYSIDDGVTDEASVKAIRDAFSKARNNAPCIIFIDEIDKFDLNDDFMMGPFPAPKSPIMRELLTQMDGFKPNSGIIVIATANSQFQLHKSFLRSGRFDRIIEIKMPNKNERKLLLEYYAKNKKIQKDVDFDRLANRTSGLCCADIDNVLNDAALIALRDKCNEISIDHIETAIDRVMFGAIENKMNDSIKNIIATHEIGHAIVSIKLESSESPNKISIISRGQTLGFNMFTEDEVVEKYGLSSKDKLFNKMVIAYGGIAAEEVMLHNITSGSTKDIDEARKIAIAMVRYFGMYGIENCSASLSRTQDVLTRKKNLKVDKIVTRLNKKAFNIAKNIIKNNRNLFDNLYNKLMEDNVLYKEEIEEIIKKCNNK